MIWLWLGRRPLVGDLALVSLLLFLTVGAASRTDHVALSAALGTLETLPLLFRRQRPALALACVTTVALAMSVLGIWGVPLTLGVALYTLATTRPPRPQRALAFGSIASVAVVVLVGDGLEFGAAAARIVFLIAAWLLGESIGSRRAYVREIEEKAERLEREQETEARRAAAEEQARIARELHDVVAHALSVIVVQAGAAADVFEVDPKLTRGPIHAIDGAARAALADLRRVLGVLQQDTDYAPQPGMSRLDGLVEQVRATGLQVALEIEGRPRPLPAAVDLSAYRIVQEALTNVLKHADADHARVRIQYDDALVVEVSDDGNGPVNGAAGSGLIGMRERTALLGGTIEAGAAADGGYRIRASLPTRDPA
jgi:signal transduction histidine kinase